MVRVKCAAQPFGRPYSVFPFSFTPDKTSKPASKRSSGFEPTAVRGVRLKGAGSGGVLALKRAFRRQGSTKITQSTVVINRLSCLSLLASALNGTRVNAASP